MIEQTFQVGPDPALDVRIASGKIYVRSGPAETITVRAKGKTDELVVEQRGSTVWISTERRRAIVDRSVYLTIELPDGADIDASVASADIICDPAVGRLTVNSASGDIRFTRAGEIIVKTASGDVHGDEVSGRVTFTSASGDLHLHTVGDRAELSTASGDVRIEEADGPITTSTMSGDIHVQRFTGEDFAAKSMSGQVNVGVPAGTSVSLDATTFSGDIRLPDPAPNGEATPVGNLNLRARLVSGDLRVRRV